MEKRSVLSPETLLDVIRIIWKWRFRIIIFVGLSTAAASVGSLLMPDYYASAAVFYPANVELASKGGLFSNGGVVPEIGAEDMTERIITYATSRDMADYMIDKFDLFEHYGMDSTKKDAQKKMYKRFWSLYSVDKDEFGAIKLQIEDQVPEMTLPMVEAALEKVNDLYQGAILDNRMRILHAYEQMLKERQAALAAVTDTLRILRGRYGIFNIDQQSQVYSELVLKTQSELAQLRASAEQLRRTPNALPDTLLIWDARAKGLENKLQSLLHAGGINSYNADKFSDGRGVIVQYENNMFTLMEEVRKLNVIYNEYKASTTLRPSVFIMAEKAQLPRSKSRPQRSQIVIGSFIISLILAVLASLLLESARMVNWKETFNNA